MSALGYLQFALIITFGIILASAYEAEQHPDMVSFENRRKSDGSYFFKYTLSDGTIRYERATFGPDTRSPDTLVLRVNGYYTYALPDGMYKYVYYKADENGFRTYTHDPNDRFIPPKPSSIEDCPPSNCQFLPPGTIAGLLG